MLLLREVLGDAVSPMERLVLGLRAGEMDREDGFPRRFDGLSPVPMT